MKAKGYGNQMAEKYLKVMIEKVKPDLCILTGDILDGRPFGEYKRLDWKETFLSFIDPLIKNKIYWSYTPGNHDDDGSPYTRKDLLAIYGLPYCFSKGAKKWDHTVTVGPNPFECVRLWLFDSGENSPDPKLKYTSFSLDAVHEYKLISKKLREQKEKAVGLAFFHIPLPEYSYNKPMVGTLGLFDAARRKGNVPAVAKWCPWLVRLFGFQRVSGSSNLQSGLYEAFLWERNILATFCGHDHYNDAVMHLYGLYMCYGRVCSNTPPVTWEGAGGPLPFDLGARVIEVRGAGKVATWIEGEDGPEKNSLIVMSPEYIPPTSTVRKILCHPWTVKIVNLIIVFMILAYLLYYGDDLTGVDWDDDSEGLIRES
uniref:Calcineurin-like phosphoesterase domain-containing protein n=1 Tax=Amorphochlora amoebiformis TaxID=1561963 RepID=A0A7S0DJL5_9EUKA